MKDDARKVVINRVSGILSLLIAVLSLVVLLEWWLNEEALPSIGLLPKMNPLTAVCLFLCAAGGMLTLLKQPKIKWLVWSIGSLVLFTTILRLTDAFLATPLSIDLILFHDRLVGTDASALSRMAPNTAACLGLLAASLLGYRRDLDNLREWLINFVLVLAYFSILGYLFRVPEFYRVIVYVPMAPHTALSLVVLSFGQKLALPSSILVQVWLGREEGARALKWLLPAAILFPLIVGYLRMQGTWLGLYSNEFGVVLFLVFVTLGFTFVANAVANSMTVRDRIRREGEMKLQAANEEVAALNEELETYNEEIISTNELLSANNIELVSVNNELSAAYAKIKEQSDIIISQKDEQLNHALDVSDSVVWSFDLTGHGNNYLSRSAERIYGRPHSELVNKPRFWIDQIHPEDIPIKQLSQKRLEQSGMTECTYRIVLPNGSIRWIHDTLRIIRNESGMEVRLEGIANDVSFIKKAEMDLDRERRLLRNLIDHIPDYIYVRDLESNNMLSNQAFVKLVNATDESATLGKSPVDLFGDAGQIYLEEDRLIVKSGKPLINKSESVVNSDGELRELITTKIPFVDSKGNVVGIIGLSRDITDIKSKQRELDSFREKLEIIFSTTLEQILLLDDTGKIVLFNDSLNRFMTSATGRKPQIGDYVWDMTVKSRRETSQQLFRRARHGESLVVEAPIMVEGHEVVMEVRYQPIYVGDAVKYIILISTDITEKKLRENKIRLSEASLRDFQQAIYNSSIVSRADRQGNITFVNKNFVEISGYSFDELLGKNHNIINSGFHPKSFWTNMWRTISSGHIWREEVKNLKKNGEYYWVDTFIMPFKDEMGRVTEYLSIRNDITRRKMAEEEVLKNKFLLDRANQIAKIGFWTYEPSTNNTLYSDKTLEIFGLSKDFDGGFEDYLAMVHPDDAEMVRQVAEETVRGVKEYNIDHRIILKNGSVRWVHEEARIEKDANGNVDHLLGIVQDITERKMAEEVLKQSNERFEFLAMATNDAVWDWHILEDFEMWNHGLKTLFGYDEVGITNVEAWWKDKVHPEDYPNLQAVIDNCVAAKSNNWSHNYRYKAADGKYKYVFDRAYIIYNGEDPVRMIGTMQDVTELTQYRQDLERLVHERTRELEEALIKEKELVELKSKFVSIASHEFRTPLATITLAAGFIKKYRDRMKSEEIEAKLNSIGKQVEHMTYLLDDVLMIGKSESGKIEVRLDTVKGQHFIKEIVRQVAESAGNARVVDFVYDATASAIITDEKLLRNILINLLTNAIKFSPAAMPVEITVKDGAPDKLEIEVRDHGIGIPKKDLPLIFESFHRASNATAINGTGLGLSIVKKAVELLKGEISVKSQIDEGTVFNVTLPIDGR